MNRRKIHSHSIIPLPSQAVKDCPYQDKNCPEFSYLYENCEKCLVKHKIPKEVPVFINELGSAKAGNYGKSWLNKQ